MKLFTRTASHPSDGLSILGFILVGSLSGCSTLGKYDPAISEWQEGGWRPIRKEASQPSNPAERSLAAERLRKESLEAFDAAAYGDSLEGFLALKSRYPDSKEAKDVATSFQIAECYYQLGEAEYRNAYPYYLEVLRANPSEDVLQKAIQRIYDIGISFLYGRARKTFLGISYRSPSYGVEILTGTSDGLTTNYPFLKLSEDALQEVASYYFREKEYAEAERFYERLARDYPQSTWKATADYQLALSVYRQIRGVDYDQVLIQKARSRFNAYLYGHPRGGQVEEAREHLRKIAEMEGQHDLNIAKYYLRESQPQAAMLYLRSVFINNPKTEAAREAREIYENLEKRRGGAGT